MPRSSLAEPQDTFPLSGRTLSRGPQTQPRAMGVLLLLLTATRVEEPAEELYLLTYAYLCTKGNVLPAPAFLGRHYKVVTAARARLCLRFRLPAPGAGSLARWDPGELPSGAPRSGRKGPGTREGAAGPGLLFRAQPSRCVNACAPASPPPPPLSFSPALQTLTFSLSFACNRLCPRGSDAAELMLISCPSPSPPTPTHAPSLATAPSPQTPTHAHTFTHTSTRIYTLPGLISFSRAPVQAPLSRGGGRAAAAGAPSGGNLRWSPRFSRGCRAKEPAASRGGRRAPDGFSSPPLGSRRRRGAGVQIRAGGSGARVVSSSAVGRVLGAPGWRGRGVAKGPEATGSWRGGERRGGWNPAGRRKSPRSLPFQRPGRSPRGRPSSGPGTRTGLAEAAFPLLESALPISAAGGGGWTCPAEVAAPRRAAGCGRSQPTLLGGGARGLAEPPCPLLPASCLSFWALTWRQSEP